MQLKDIQGKQMPAIDVFSAAIAYLKDHLLKNVRVELPESAEKNQKNERTKLNFTTDDKIPNIAESIANAMKNPQFVKKIKESDFLWVITVPAIWEDGARQFMRKAAIKAHFWEDYTDGFKRFNHDTFAQDGGKHETISRQTMLALEPEAAALDCKFLQLQLIRSKDGRVSTAPFTPGQRFLLADLGGGTADMIAFKVLKSGDLLEHTKPNGGNWGGGTVDEAFWGLLKQHYGDEVIDEFATKESSDYLEMQGQFERKKSISTSKTEVTRITLCRSLAKTYKKVCGVKLKNGMIRPEEWICYNKDKLELSHKVSLSFFQKPKEKLIAFLAKQYFVDGNRYNLDTIVMVGGFSESEEMKEVKAVFTKMGIKVIVPKEARLATVKGAVLYGHNHTAIREQILPCTYGISIRVPFDETIHPTEKRIWCSNRQTHVAEDVFQPFMWAGTRVIPGETFAEHRYKAL